MYYLYCVFSALVLYSLFSLLLLRYMHLLFKFGYAVVLHHTCTRSRRALCHLFYIQYLNYYRNTQIGYTFINSNINCNAFCSYLFFIFIIYIFIEEFILFIYFFTSSFYCILLRMNQNNIIYFIYEITKLYMHPLFHCARLYYCLCCYLCLYVLQNFGKQNWVSSI